MLNIADNQRVTVWTIENQGNYSLVQMSSSRKDKSSGEYKNSSWSYVRFVGEAHKKAGLLKRQDKILLKGAVLSKEPYEKNGETTSAKNPQITVFNWEYQEDNRPTVPTGKDFDAPPSVIYTEEEADNPF